MTALVQAVRNFFIEEEEGEEFFTPTSDPIPAKIQEEVKTVEDVKGQSLPTDLVVNPLPEPLMERKTTIVISLEKQFLNKLTEVALLKEKLTILQSISAPTKDQKAIKRCRADFESLKKWFSDKEQEILTLVGTYQNEYLDSLGKKPSLGAIM